MKRVFGVATLAMLACAGVAVAQNFEAAPNGGPSRFAPCVLGTDDITQSLDCSIVTPTGIACAAGGVTTDTMYPRRYFLNADHAITGAYTVDAVQFGVEVDTAEGSGACTGNPITINCYTIANGAAFTYANMTQLDSVTVNLGGTAGGTIVTAAMNGTCVIGDPVAEDLVVEYVSCDHLNDGLGFGQFFPGANGLGETQPSYIAAPDCGIFDPIALDDIGFPDSDNVTVVEGTEEGDPCRGAFIGEPKVRSRSGSVSITYRLDITHQRGTVQVPIYIELQDRAGNAVAAEDLGLFTLEEGRTVSLRKTMSMSTSLDSGFYVLVAKVPRMRRLIEFKRLIYIP